MPLWLRQRLNKDYLPSAENIHPTKRGKCSRPGWLAVSALPFAQWGQPIKGVMSQRVKPHLCWWWGTGNGCPWTPGCLLQGSGTAGNCLSWDRTENGSVRLPQHPMCPVYGDKPVWSFPTTGLWCGSPSLSKSQSTPNSSIWRIQGMDINLTQPVEHPQVFYSLSSLLPEENSSHVSYCFWWSVSSLHFISLLGSPRR